MFAGSKFLVLRKEKEELERSNLELQEDVRILNEGVKTKAVGNFSVANLTEQSVAVYADLFLNCGLGEGKSQLCTKRSLC